LNWHYKWYLLVIDFGDPFKTWKDWNVDGAKCFAQTLYPTSRLGCGFVDNFGQNFIIIFCVLAFCLLVSSIMIYDWMKNRRSPARTAGGRNFFRSNTVIEKTMNKTLATVYIGLGMPYFFRFMDSIQPSLIYFSMLQFATYVNKTTNLGISVFFAVMFFVYYLSTTLVSFLLAKKLWESISDSDEEVKDLGRTARKYGGWFRNFSFHYNGYTKVSRFWHLLYPIVEYFRVLIITIFMVTLRSYPKTALGLILMVEIVRIAYISILHKYRISFLYAVQDYVITGFFVLYLILKIASNDKYTEEAIQKRLGWAMAFFLGIIWSSILLDLILDTYFVVKEIIENRKKKGEDVKADSPIQAPIMSDARLGVVNFEQTPIVDEAKGGQSPPPRIRPPVSSNRRGDYESDDMNEEYSVMGEQRREYYDPNQVNVQLSGADGYMSRDMNENHKRTIRGDTSRFAGEGADGYMSRDMNENHKRTIRGDTSRLVEEGADGYYSKDMNEKHKKTNRNDSSRVVDTDRDQVQPSITGPVTNNKVVTSGLVQEQINNQPDQNYGSFEQPFSSDRGKANYDSREMEEDE
jgi:hypothetical protein